ncbi:MAG: glycosyltransferase, partial [Sphingomonadales bacterium]
LILSHKPPYPIADGGCLAMSRLLTDLLALEKVSQVTYHTLGTYKHPFQKEAFPKHPKLELRAQQIDTRVRISGALFALLRQESYNLVRFKDAKVLAALQKELSVTTYDFVLFESLFAAVYAAPLRNFSKAHFIYRAHNIEHQIWKDLASNTKNLLKKWYLHQLAYALKWAERSIWREDQGALDLILTISHTDLHQIEAQTLTTCKHLPASIDQTTNQSNCAPMKMCFLGAFNWYPNIEAVNWFLDSVFADLQAKHPTLEFHIAGKDAEQFKHWLRPGVFVHGFVPDAKKFIAENGIFVGCLQSGSGVKMKILEAMRVGAPLVLSRKSADGLPQLDTDLIKTNENDFKQDLLQLLQYPQHLEARSAYFKQYFKNHFETIQVRKLLQSVLDELQNNR